MYQKWNTSGGALLRNPIYELESTNSNEIVVIDSKLLVIKCLKFYNLNVLPERKIFSSSNSLPIVDSSTQLVNALFGRCVHRFARCWCSFVMKAGKATAKEAGVVIDLDYVASNIWNRVSFSTILHFFSKSY